MSQDLTYANLQAALPTGALTVEGNDVVLSIRSIIGESSLGLNDQKVSEFIAKLLEACNRAQRTYNNANQTNGIDLNSYPSPVAGIPQQENDGSWYAVFTYTTSVRVPLNLNETSAMPI